MDTIPGYVLLRTSSLFDDGQIDEKLHLLMGILQDGAHSSSENLAFLDEIEADDNTPTLHRATAAFTHGMMLLQQDVNDLATNKLRKTISLCDNMSLQELDSQVFVGVEESSQSPLFVSVRDYLAQPDSIRNLAQLNLDSLDASKSDERFEAEEFIPQKLDSNHTPGTQCDECGVLAEFEQTGSTIRAHLKPCQGWETKFYCCVACQRNAWETGHQSICRPSTSLVQFDLVRIHGLKNSKYTHMNGNVYEVRGPARLSAPGDVKWIVCEVGGAGKAVVAKYANVTLVMFKEERSKWEELKQQLEREE
ncbi:hypothetical protein HDU98_010618 [Podochytrium sp. JEL0797]|nr:hypothetical protein HDU98_010618 [Podochytrium sp. JEL0797]